jgi:uncharacterized protein
MSPRYKKPRACGCKLMGKAYKPTGIPMAEIEKITLYSDELEAFKLCDMDDLTQEEAGEFQPPVQRTIKMSSMI